MANTFELLRVARAVLAKLGLIATREMSLNPDISLVLNVNDLVNETKAVDANYDISSAAKVMGTVPEGKRWWVLVVYRAATVGVATQIYLVVRGVNGVLQVPQAAANATPLLPGLPIEQGDAVWLAGSGNVADTSIPATFIYWEESLSITRPQA